MASSPVFYYDFASPYAYLAASRIDVLIPDAIWQPVILSVLAEHAGRVPWSLRPGPQREERIRACEEEAAEIGVPLAWPENWPTGTYTTGVHLAALAADEQGLLREFSLAAFHEGLGRGRDLRDRAVLADAAAAAGADPEPILASAERSDLRAKLRAATAAAAERGVRGVPSVAVGLATIWGNDQLLRAALLAQAHSSAA